MRPGLVLLFPVPIFMVCHRWEQRKLRQDKFQIFHHPTAEPI